MLKISFIVLFQISLHYAQFYHFYAASSITIPYLQFKLPIKISDLSYLMLVKPLKIKALISLSLMLHCFLNPKGKHLIHFLPHILHDRLHFLPFLHNL